MNRFDGPGLPVPPARPPYTPVIAVRVGLPLFVIVTGEELYGVDLHYLDDWKRTVPCYRDPCVHCGDGLGKHYKAYVSGIVPRNGRVIVVELTESAARQVERITAAAGGRLRGLQLSLRRAAPRRNAEVLVQMHGRCPAADVGPAVPVLPVLERLWGLSVVTTTPAPAPAPAVDAEGFPC